MELNRPYGGNAEDQRANKNADSEVTVHKASYRNKNSAGNWTREHSCYILAKNKAVLCLCPDSLSEAELKSNGLICLAEEISLQHSTEPVAWLLPIALVQINDEREQKNGEMCSSARKGT